MYLNGIHPKLKRMKLILVNPAHCLKIVVHHIVFFKLNLLNKMYKTTRNVRSEISNRSV